MNVTSHRRPSISRLRSRRDRSAFTLIEVTLAIGIIAFAFVGIFSLLPTGMAVFQRAMDTSIGAQIAQRIVSEAQQADFDALVPEDDNRVEGATKGGSGNQYYALPIRYFDDQGTELGVIDGSNALPQLSAAEKLRVIYTVRVRGSLPGAPNPSTHSNSFFTSLPSSGDQPRFNPRSATYLTIQVVRNPGRLSLDQIIDTSDTFLVDPVKAKEKNFPLQTYPAIIARSAYRNAN